MKVDYEYKKYKHRGGNLRFTLGNQKLHGLGFRSSRYILGHIHSKEMLIADQRYASIVVHFVLSKAGK